MVKKILIFGSNGMLGTYMYNTLKHMKDAQIIPLKRCDYNIDTLSYRSLSLFLHKYVSTTDYDAFIIVNCAGLIPQRLERVEQSENMKSYFKINSLFPNLLSAYIQNANEESFENYLSYNKKLKSYHFIHITTDCVFNGIINKSYDENDEYNPLYLENNIYGTTKHLGELCNSEMVNEIDCVTIIRTSIIGEELYNKASFIEFLKKNANGNVQGYDNHYWNGVTTLQLSKIVKKMIENNAYYSGIRHFYSPKIYSKYEMLNMINTIFHLNVTIEKINHKNSLNKSLKSIFNTCESYKIPDLEVQIKELYNSTLFDTSIHINVDKDKMIVYPFPYLMIDEILNVDFAKSIQEEILNIKDDEWDRYDNPFEQKYTLRNKNNFPRYTAKLFEILESDQFIDTISKIVGIKLFKDEYRHFWGVHKYKDNDYLDIHVDAGIHPKNKMKKQVTLGIYLSKDINEMHNGQLELWSGDNAVHHNAKIFKKCVSIAPLFNRLILFECNDYSWHGNPNPVICKNDERRIFLTLSYLSEEYKYGKYLNNREKAFFVPRPEDPYNEEKDKLRYLRADPEKYASVYNCGKNN